MSVLLDILAAGVVDDTGEPLDSGLVYVYGVGTTSRVDVFSDPDLTVPVSNPITLDSAGKAVAYTEDSVRLFIEDSGGNTIADIDSVGSESSGVQDLTSVLPQQLIPIGGMIPFYDFNGDLSFNTDYWKYCNGSSQVIGGSARTLPDMSNRYIVGFGTEGGADVGSAAWATAAVGLANHQANLAHVHAVASHFHRIPTIPVGIGTNAGVSLDGTLDTTTASTSKAGNASGSDGDAGFNTSSTLSATESIQPRSIRARWIMRAK